MSNTGSSTTAISKLIWSRKMGKQQVRRIATVSSNLVSKTGVSKKRHYKLDPMLGT